MGSMSGGFDGSLSVNVQDNADMNFGFPSVSLPRNGAILRFLWSFFENELIHKCSTILKVEVFFSFFLDGAWPSGILG